MSASEVWDVTDETGAPVGSTHVRGAPGWPPGRFHVVAATCVVDAAERVLLTRRGAGKDFAGAWEFPGGSAVAGESSPQAAVRELGEEIGLRVHVDDVRWVDRLQEGTSLFDLYVASAPAPQVPRPDGVEVDGFDWVDLTELERRWSNGELGGPWEARLQVFWTPLVAAVEDLARSSADEEEPARTAERAAARQV